MNTITCIIYFVACVHIIKIYTLNDYLFEEIGRTRVAKNINGKIIQVKLGKISLSLLFARENGRNSYFWIFSLFIKFNFIINSIYYQFHFSECDFSYHVTTPNIHNFSLYKIESMIDCLFGRQRNKHMSELQYFVFYLKTL